MPTDSALKRQVRDRMVYTGESYTVARKAVLAACSAPADPAPGGMVGVLMVTTPHPRVFTPDAGEDARRAERDAIVEWLRDQSEDAHAVGDNGHSLALHGAAESIARGDHLTHKRG